jgi:hypothetical protein
MLYRVLAETNGIEREVPQSAIWRMPPNTSFRAVLTKSGRKRNEERREKRAKKKEQEKEETPF